MIGTPFQHAKYRHRFQLLDTDHNHYLTRTDYQAIADRFIAGFALTGPDAATITDVYTQLFHRTLQVADTDHDHRISETEFIHASALSLLARPDGFEHAIVPVLDAVAAICDRDHSSTLDRRELHTFLTAEGVTDPRQATALLFPAGVNEDSTTQSLTFTHLTSLARDFYCSADPTAPGNHLLGPFPLCRAR